MRFRSLAFDYHTEAVHQLLQEQKHCDSTVWICPIEEDTCEIDQNSGGDGDIQEDDINSHRTPHRGEGIPEEKMTPATSGASELDFHSDDVSPQSNDTTKTPAQPRRTHLTAVVTDRKDEQEDTQKNQLQTPNVNKFENDNNESSYSPEVFRWDDTCGNEMDSETKLEDIIFDPKSQTEEEKQAQSFQGARGNSTEDSFPKETTLSAEAERTKPEQPTDASGSPEQTSEQVNSKQQNRQIHLDTQILPEETLPPEAEEKCASTEGNAQTTSYQVVSRRSVGEVESATNASKDADDKRLAIINFGFQQNQKDVDSVAENSTDALEGRGTEKANDSALPCENFQSVEPESEISPIRQPPRREEISTLLSVDPSSCTPELWQLLRISSLRAGLPLPVQMPRQGIIHIQVPLEAISYLKDKLVRAGRDGEQARGTPRDDEHVDVKTPAASEIVSSAHDPEEEIELPAESEALHEIQNGSDLESLATGVEKSRDKRIQVATSTNQFEFKKGDLSQKDKSESPLFEGIPSEQMQAPRVTSKLSNDSNDSFGGDWEPEPNPPRQENFYLSSPEVNSVKHKRKLGEHSDLPRGRQKVFKFDVSSGYDDTATLQEISAQNTTTTVEDSATKVSPQKPTKAQTLDTSRTNNTNGPQKHVAEYLEARDSNVQDKSVQLPREGATLIGAASGEERFNDIQNSPDAKTPIPVAEPSPPKAVQANLSSQSSHPAEEPKIANASFYGAESSTLADVEYTFDVPIDECSELEPDLNDSLPSSRPMQGPRGSIVSSKMPADLANDEDARARRKERKQRKKERKERRREKKKKRKRSSSSVPPDMVEDTQFSSVGINTTPGTSPAAKEKFPSQPMPHAAHRSHTANEGVKKKHTIGGLEGLSTLEVTTRSKLQTASQNQQGLLSSNMLPNASRPNLSNMYRPTETHQVGEAGRGFVQPEGATGRLLPPGAPWTSAIRETPQKHRNRFSEMPPVQILCSEKFLEEWGEIVTDLASGRWTSSIFQNVNRHASVASRDRDLSGRKIRLIDTSLLEHCGVDIELPGRRGVIVQSISNYTGDEAVCREMIEKLVIIASHERYKTIQLILFTEVDLSPNQTTAMSKILNAFGGDECPTKVQVHVCTILGLSLFLAKTILHSVHGENIALYQQAADASTSNGISDRALFLIKMLPTLCTIDALKCIRGDGTKSPEERLHSLLYSRIERINMSAGLSSPKPMQQLGEILRASLNIDGH